MEFPIVDLSSALDGLDDSQKARAYALAAAQAVLDEELPSSLSLIHLATYIETGRCIPESEIHPVYQVGPPTIVTSPHTHPPTDLLPPWMGPK